MPSNSPTRRDPDLGRLVEKLARERRCGFESYKESCLRRRVAVRMRARGARTYEEYAALLDRDAGEYDRLIDALTINVTKFFRNRETWDVLVRDTLPTLLRERDGEIRCWSAGCASGEEPYTLAIAFAEAAGAVGAVLERLHIDATDLDAKSLERARRGVYGAQAFEEMLPTLIRGYFTGEGPRTIVPWIRERVRFQRHDLVSEPAPAPPYDLILCRNVLIYFDRATQDRLLAGFIEALRPAAYLVLGKSETLLGGIRTHLSLVNARERVYRRS